MIRAFFVPSMFNFELSLTPIAGVLSEATIRPRPVDPPAPASHSDPE